MTRDDALIILRRSKAELVRRGVRRAALFGSTARNDATDRSDVDVMLELDPSFAFDVYSYVALKNFIADQFPIRVDVANRADLRPYVKALAEKDAVYAF